MEEKQTVKPLTEKRECADVHQRSPLPDPVSPQHLQSETVVVVLGVMYPRALPRLLEADTLNLVPARSGLIKDRQSADVVFHDPLSSSRGVYKLVHGHSIAGIPGAGLMNRVEAHKAVARDLALLSSGKRR